MTDYSIFLVISLSIAFLSICGAIAIAAVSKRQILTKTTVNKPILTWFQILTGGVFVSAVVLLMPGVSSIMHDNSWREILTSVILSFQKTLQLFTIDADFSLVADMDWKGQSDAVYTAYHIYASVLHIVAPVLTAGIVLSFFKNAKAYLRYYIFSVPSNLYVISELNERSIALAQDIFITAKKEKQRAIIVFSDVFEQKEDETNYELVVKARSLGCVLFAKDIAQIRLRPILGNNITRKVYFIGDNEDENVRQALAVISNCRKDRSNGTPSVYNTDKTEFYVFARSAESEVLLNSLDNGNMKVRRIDENRNFVLRTLMEHPIFFEALPPVAESDNKRLNIVLVGLGMIGTEFVKALTWVGQMYGYDLSLHVFDGEADIEKRLRGVAPGLVENNFICLNRARKVDEGETYTAYYTSDAVVHKPRIDGYPYYNLYYYDEINVKTQEFLDIIDGLDDVSTVYVTLGDDELNIETAMRLRMQFERGRIKEKTHIPAIYSVVYSEIKNTIISGHNGLKTIKNDDYGITMVGSLRSSYTLAALEQKRIEKAGLECHLKWSSSDDDKKKSIDSYSKFEYYRRSSMAEALHAYIRGLIGLVPGANDGKLDSEIYKYEHCRWSAFVLSEGYIYAEEKSDLAKTHNSLLPYDALSNSVRLLDQIVISETMVGGENE